ncbi:Hsp20/alpha crystallin family protein [Mastigocoleus testarum]|uniref:Molecular chaperone n=1 Tax=Mastigocoleus testarum BC008 TaxID=371196 RepID=A0A0V7ZNL5_9CYAN|nr:Hsp20/alpha crystallin family protein [Mastigocoleus testarum]KST66153.1 molecular chaperone [Mastigocoleus testarum BC008]
MALIHWQPFQEMEALRRDMNRLFDSLSATQEQSMMQQMTFLPAAEMEETENTINLKLEIPGVEAKDLDVQVTKEAVIINGERKSESNSKQNGVTRSEFRYGMFSRTIPLPNWVDNTNVKGNYKNGILKLELPKTEKQNIKVSKVNISSASSSKDCQVNVENC